MQDDSPPQTYAKSFASRWDIYTRLRARGHLHNLIEEITSEVKFTERKSALQQNRESAKNNSALCNNVPPSVAGRRLTSKTSSGANGI